MKFKMVRQPYMGDHTIDGKTEQVPRTRSTAVPVLPRDVDAILTKASLGMALALTAASIAWSTYAIGSLLGATVGYVAAGVFDAAWLTCLMLEYLARFDPARRAFPRRLGWLLLAGTMAAIGIHGWMSGGIAAAVVGAAVSAFAKMLWHGVMRHLSPDLSADDREWLKIQASKAHTKAAVATVQRTAARIEQRAALEMLAIERDRAQVAEAFGLSLAPAAELPLQREVPQVPAAELPQVPAAELGSAQVPAAELPARAEVPAWIAGSPAVPAAVAGEASEVPRDETANRLVSKVTGTSQRNHAEPIDGKTAGHLRSVQNHDGTAATPTAMIRALIAAGITNPVEIRQGLESSGTKVPADSYIRRVVRASRNHEVPATGTDGYI